MYNPYAEGNINTPPFVTLNIPEKDENHEKKEAGKSIFGKLGQIKSDDMLIILILLLLLFNGEEIDPIIVVGLILVFIL